jgi:hypothetical protein
MNLFIRSQDPGASNVERHLLGDEQMNDILSEIRSLEGLKYFLTSPPAKMMQEMAKEGPIVILMNSKPLNCSYAIIVMEDGIRAFGLEKLE